MTARVAGLSPVRRGERNGATAATPSLLQKPLLLVTGKGGTGKTTVAAALGLAAAATGRRALVCELAGQQRLARAFGSTPAQGGATRLADRLDALTIDPQKALEEWLRRQPSGAGAVAVIKRSRAFAHFVAAAPGAKELVTIGKVVDLARRPSPYDLVIVDAPSTGHALALVEAPTTFAGIAPFGPIAREAQELARFLADPPSTGYVGVSLPEEMSLQEILDLERRLREAVGRSLDLIVVNGVHPLRFTDHETGRLRQAADEPVVRAVLAERERARVHAGRVRRLRGLVDARVATLPFLFGAELGPDDYARLAARLGSGERPATAARAARRRGLGTLAGATGASPTSPS